MERVIQYDSCDILPRRFLSGFSIFVRACHILYLIMGPTVIWMIYDINKVTLMQQTAGYIYCHRMGRDRLAKYCGQ